MTYISAKPTKTQVKKARRHSER